ncbi:hypothetical protein [Stratiformator vulcanicus]|uniref:Uncharacterized protein n=1 Tax=Stratiformator vulcanicus TaxID=2527980 RepID=A0A517R3D8_9PLAN|nr:hypothetical protein [Stratiformator vulcanicus]QDT38391.1 hypothetical protein Pan189_27840 [Stratiformator vulcanicus]
MPAERKSKAAAETVPSRLELETRFDSRVVTFLDEGVERPGGMCHCCGSGPNENPGWRADPWYVYQAGLCDGDGVYYSMLCEGCLEDIRAKNANRERTLRDEFAKQVTELLGDDVDGAQTMMDDLEGSPDCRLH